MRNDFTPQRDPSSDDVVIRAAEMYERLRDKAEQAVLSSYDFRNNVLCGSVVRLASIGSNSQLLIKFAINGHERTVRADLPSEVASTARAQYFEALRKAVADAVADEVLKITEYGGLGRMTVGESLANMTTVNGRP